MPKIIFSEFVEPELTAIWDYIASDNLDAADRFLAAASSTFEELAWMPGMGHARRFPQERLRHLRSFRIKNFDNYLIFYSPIPDGIEVFHIVHAARDMERFLEGE